MTTWRQKLLGRDPLAIDASPGTCVPYVGFRSTGVEGRAASAIDIALWDLFGKAVKQPLVQLLGGWTRKRIRTYNTCAGAQYMRRSETQSSANWGLGAERGAISGFDDLSDFLHRAGDLAQSLLDEGITAMKIWPFDVAGREDGGHYISPGDLKSALEPFRKYRAASRRPDGCHGRISLTVAIASGDPDCQQLWLLPDFLA